ncbi:phosphonate transport system substrate-binding protein [Shimia isoporae]|uniref:Phosphonate transport system substrate-binding protein n=1 Tax=Shimia isoporae TaxID=647720 RepID=A0A4R1NAX2_9RHOB|nr:phosphate/phosphite/phosphonate ABC transporter substrate-binding protein [Shimia isoporae]TCL01259.1 phosphonate transport system substrate-binding protein [Shimia isoporae]
MGNRLIGCVFAVITLFAQTASATELVFATLNDNIRKQADRFARLEVYLEDTLSDFGISNVVLEVFRNAEDVQAAMNSGAVDFYFDSPLIAAQISAPVGGEVFLRRWKKGVAEYHSVVFVKQDSPYEELSDLVGARIAMQEPTSTSGFLLPLAELTANGLPTAELPDRKSEPSAKAVNYVFSGDDDTSALWVIRGHVEAAATDNATFEKLQTAASGQYRSIGVSPTVPRQLLVKRAGLAPELEAKLADILTTMHETPEGAEILYKFNKTTKFERFETPTDAVMAQMLEILDDLATAGAIE